MALSTYTVVLMATVVRGATTGVAAVVGCASDYYQVVDSWLSWLVTVSESRVFTD